jgi:hypothetical protein
MTKSSSLKDRLRLLKHKWRDQVMFDHELTPSTRCVGYCAANYITMDATRDKYRDTDRIIIWPSQKTLAAETGFNIETVSRAIKQLRKHGHLKRTQKGNQHTGSNRYRIVMKEENSDRRAA